jgi:hypothetical protein
MTAGTFTKPIFPSAKTDEATKQRTVIMMRMRYIEYSFKVGDVA